MLANSSVYPHNDLLNLAFYHIDTIRTKVKTDEDNGLALDCHSCLIAIAFSVEALINFVGDKKVDGWNEYERFHIKMEQVCEIADIKYDESVEPFSTLNQIKQLRNLMAHGKPIEGGEGMKCAWDDFLHPEFSEESYKQVKEFQRLLLEGCEIGIEETITSNLLDIK